MMAGWQAAARPRAVAVAAAQLMQLGLLLWAARTYLVLVVVTVNSAGSGVDNNATFPRRTKFPQPKPEVCLVLVSSAAANLDTLGTAYAASIAYLERQNSSDTVAGAGGSPSAPLRYEVAWYDGGSAAAERERFQGRLPQLEAELLRPTNLGL